MTKLPSAPPFKSDRVLGYPEPRLRRSSSCFATSTPPRRYADTPRSQILSSRIFYCPTITPSRPYAITPIRPYADMSSRYSREFLSLDIELQIVQPAIHRRGVQKLAMGTNFSDLTSLHDDDLVGL